MLELTKERLHRIVCEEYHVLLRADAELALPKDYPQIADFYRKAGEACIEWAVAAHGEALRRKYLEIEDHAARARVRTCTYVLHVKPVWEERGHGAWVCHSVITEANGEKNERTMAQVWNLSEQTALPPYQVLLLCRPTHAVRPSFRPDGVYPQNGALVFYKHAENGNPPKELRVPYRQVAKREGDPKKADSSNSSLKGKKN